MPSTIQYNYFVPLSVIYFLMNIWCLKVIMCSEERIIPPSSKRQRQMLFVKISIRINLLVPFSFHVVIKCSLVINSYIWLYHYRFFWLIKQKKRHKNSKNKCVHVSFIMFYLYFLSENNIVNKKMSLQSVLIFLQPQCEQHYKEH